MTLSSAVEQTTDLTQSISGPSGRQRPEDSALTEPPCQTVFSPGYCSGLGASLPLSDDRPEPG